MDGERLPQPVHPVGTSAVAPGELELVRSFLSLHDHRAGTTESLQPSRAALAWWLRDKGLVASPALPDGALAWAEGVRLALVTKVRENMGEPPDPAAIATLNAAAEETGLRPRFDAPRLDVRGDGVHAAIGRLLAIAFVAEMDGSWHRLRTCADPTCTAVFYDRSKNHSGRWCSMATCGNRNKVRAFRERRAAEP